MAEQMPWFGDGQVGGLADHVSPKTRATRALEKLLRPLLLHDSDLPKNRSRSRFNFRREVFDRQSDLSNKF